MKKIISVIIPVLLLFSCLGLTAFAENSSVTISDDYQKLYLDGNSYSRFNNSTIEVEYFSFNADVELNATQQELIDEVVLETNENITIISADIYFKDGAVLSVGFLHDDYLEIYNEISTGQITECIIDFEWPEGNTVVTEKTALLGDAVTLYGDDLKWCDYYPVIIKTSDESLTLYEGALLIINDEYYYTDFSEAAVANWYDFNPYDYSELPAHKITDTELLASIKAAEEEYYSDDLGFLYDDNLTETVSAVFLIFVFAIVPFAILVVFLVLAIRSKTVYRKMFSTICILSGAELAIFAIITAFVMMPK